MNANNPFVLICRAVAKVVWFCLMCGFVCLGLLICALGAMGAGADSATIRENTQEQFLRFVEGWTL